MISIIIRTKNEERWIVACLQAIKDQTIQDVEIVLVDNNSTDKTVAKARSEYPNLTYVTIEEFKPGLAINDGIRASKGEYIVCLSAHCIPTDKYWLENLLRNLTDEPNVAGVYGRQIPMEHTPAADKRDLIITFGLDRRVQIKDPFFHNANSMFRRTIWDKYPFDENVTNIEDRVWGQVVINAGMQLVYEPEAVVFHHHGIHQGNDKKRSEGVIRILNDIKTDALDSTKKAFDPKKLNVIAIIPLREHHEHSIDMQNDLVQKTITSIQNAEYIDNIVVTTDSERISDFVQALGVKTIIHRPKSLSETDVRVDDVLQYTLEEFEKSGLFPDLIVLAEITYPFRPDKMLDEMIEQIINEGLDTVIAGIPEYRLCWIQENGEFKRVDDFTHIRDERTPLYVGIPSLGCVTYPEFIRKGTRIGKKIGIHTVSDIRSGIEVRNPDEYLLVKSWLKE